MNISSPDVTQERSFKGCLVIPERGLFSLGVVKKTACEGNRSLSDHRARVVPRVP